MFNIEWIDNFIKLNNLNIDFFINDYKMDFELDKLKDVDKGAQLLKDKISNNKRVLLVTDYDCDGISSAIVLTKFFRDVLYYENFDTLLNRRKLGNGFNPKLLNLIGEKHLENKIDLIITADHGSSDDLAFQTLRSEGIDLIVTDHHEVPKPLKHPNVFINVMRDDSEYFKGISGCHVAFLLCVETYKLLNKDLKDLDILLPYVAISTVVDQMPMNNKHNRNVVKTGLNYINRKSDKNFELFKVKTKMGYMIRNKDIGFKVGPFFNSGNRTNNEVTVFESFSHQDLNIASERMDLGLLYNQRRKDEQKKSTQDIELHMQEVYPDMKDVFAVALELETTFGIAGPIASKIGADINRPVIIFKEHGYDNAILTGSGRAIIDIDGLKVIKKIMADRPDVVLKCGGHAKAFGIEVDKNKLDLFRKLFSNYVKEEVNGIIPKVKYDIVAKLKPEDIGLNLFYQIEEMGPYGNSYNEPTFEATLEYVRHYSVGPGVSIDFKRCQGSYMSGIYFFGNNEEVNKIFAEIKPGDKCKVIFSLSLNSIYTMSTNKTRYKLSLDIMNLEVEETA